MTKKIPIKRKPKLPIKIMSKGISLTFYNTTLDDIVKRLEYYTYDGKPINFEDVNVRPDEYDLGIEFQAEETEAEFQGRMKKYEKDIKEYIQWEKQFGPLIKAQQDEEYAARQKETEKQKKAVEKKRNDLIFYAKSQNMDSIIPMIQKAWTEDDFKALNQVMRLK